MTLELTDSLINALADYFDCDIEDIEYGWDSTYCTLYLGGKEYLVCTDEIADEKVKEYIADTLWAFNASFLSVMTDLPEEVFEALSENCENGNEPIRKLIDKTCGFDDFVHEAVAADGRGHFLAGYDGKEIEIDVDGETYYIYRNS